MSAGIKISGDKLLLLGAAAAFLLSCLWFRERQADIHHLRHGPLLSPRSGLAYHPEKWPQPEAMSRTWPNPAAQASGSGWTYEVFSPPPIYSNADATVVTVGAPPPVVAESDSLPGALLTVKRAPFRLQLVGYVGEPGNFRAVFVRPGQLGTWLLREGQDLPDLGLTLQSLSVETLAPARAILYDAWQGETVVLDCRSIRPTGVLLALLRSAGEPQTREYREGDAWTSGGVTYRIERIRLEPPEVVLTRPGLDGSGLDRKALHPMPGAMPPGKLIANAPGARPQALASEHD